MEGINALQVMQAPSRSISLPARLRPSSLKIEAEFNKLKTWKSSSLSSAFLTTPLGVESIQTGLIRLADLYNCIDEFVHSALPRQTLRNQQHVELVEEALDRSIGLLDACNSARDLILSMKEQVQDLQSALRRRGGDYSSMETNVHAYINFRKKSKKDIAKCLRALKRIESNTEPSPIIAADQHQHLFMVMNVLRESSAITISIFRSLFLFLSMPVLKTKASGWSTLITKLIPAASEKGQKLFNEVRNVDIALYSLHEQIRRQNGKVDVQMTLKRLETVDVSIKSLERGFDCLFRSLIQNRVSLLNVLTPSSY